jgi:hypothetical protein
MLILAPVKAQPPAFEHQDSLIRYLVFIQSDTHEGNATEAYFAALYLQTTQFIDRMCDQSRFKDADFVRKMMLDFGNRFAFAVYYKDSLTQLPEPWKDAFYGRKKPLTETQKLTLAINAHVNYDLPESLFSLYPLGSIRHLYGDFKQIDEIFDSIGIAFYQRVIGIYPWNEREIRVLNRSMKGSMKFGSWSRKRVFNLAEKYAKGDKKKKGRIIKRKNRRANQISGLLSNPKGLLKRSFHILQKTEFVQPQENINRWFGT